MSKVIPIEVGQKFESVSCGTFEVIDIYPKRKIKVKFLVTGFETIAQKSHVVRGNVRDHFLPNKLGVGFLGAMAGNTRVNKKPRQSHVIWHNMLVRCYDPNYHKMHPTYIDCSVCEEWKDYSKFHIWFEENYIEGYHLDKDKKFKGNKIYSPETCVFLSPKENTTLSNLRNKKVKVQDLSGKVYEILNATQFCKEHKIHKGNFNRMLTGHRRMAGGFVLVKEMQV